MNAVITGATKGMGRAISLKLAEAGYNVAICSRSQQDVDSFCLELKQLNPNITAVGLSTNCAHAEQVYDFVDFVKQHFGQVDVLINNVGTFKPGSILDEEESDMMTQFELNFHAAYILCRAFGKQMRERRSGYIINICSMAALNPVAEAGSYTVTKFALHGLTKVLRLELKQHNVKVTAILPGSTLTSSWEGTTLPEDYFVAADDIANAVLYCLNTKGGANTDEIVISPLTGQI
ncbi:MAG TPA: SDR family oxidoreductase [Pedobacter sp.]|jgi:short-subunit dehydrogenase